MGRNLNEILDALPKERRQRVEARYRELKNEVESLQELRAAAGKAQAEIATALNVKQPSVSKIEKQTDMYLSTLRNYIKAMGGELDLVVRFPSRPAIHILRLGDASGHASRSQAGRDRQGKSGRKPTASSKMKVDA
jgi:transcriptional regulator with XRE-family HTH domain